MLSEEQVKEKITGHYMDFWNHYFPEMTKDEQNKIYIKFIHEGKEADLYNGVKETLQKLHSSGIKLFIISADPPSKLIPEMKKGEVYDFFIDIKTMTYHKNEDIISFIEKHSLKPEETMYVGDTVKDIESGKKAGIKTAGMTWGFTSEHQLRKAKPDYILHNISELEKLI